MDQFADKFDKMINELNEPNLPRTSLTQNRGQWSTKLVTIAKKIKTMNSDDESKPLINGTTTLKADDSLSYIIAINNDVVQLSDRKHGFMYFYVTSNFHTISLTLFSIRIDKIFSTSLVSVYVKFTL